MSPQVVGFLRTFGGVVIFAALGFLANAANLAFLSPQIAYLIAAVATALLGSLDANIEQKTGKALFGAVMQNK